MDELSKLTEAQAKTRWHLLLNPGVGETAAAKALLSANHLVYRQWPIAGYFVDIALPKYRVAVEIDDPDKFTRRGNKRQIKRHEAIEKQGWKIIRILKHKAKYPNYVIKCVNSALKGN